MRRSLCFLLSATLAFSMTACGSKKTTSDVEPTTTPTATEAPIDPTSDPTEIPVEPTVEPTLEPTAEPTVEPTVQPEVTVAPTKEPEVTKAPTATPKPTKAPEATKAPTATPKPTKAPKPTSTPKPTKAPTATPAPEVEKKSLEDIMATIYEGVETPRVMNTEITAENFSYFLNMDAISGVEGLASDAMIGSIAHSVVLLRVPETEDIKSIAKDVEKNANPRKWICVQAEQVTVTYKDDVILLVMSNKEVADALVANFKN